jgi:hypothetical protein
LAKHQSRQRDWRNQLQDTQIVKEQPADVPARTAANFAENVVSVQTLQIVRRNLQKS